MPPKKRKQTKSMSISQRAADKRRATSPPPPDTQPVQPGLERDTQPVQPAEQPITASALPSLARANSVASSRSVLSLSPSFDGRDRRQSTQRRVRDKFDDGYRSGKHYLLGRLPYTDPRCR